MSKARLDHPRIIIIGAGLSGLCMAIRLQNSGFKQVTVFESSDDVGGTWFKNTYPNAGCDVPSYLYSFSFALDFDWSEKYARQGEILEYLRRCSDRFDIRKNIRFNTRVMSCVFDETTNIWNVTTNDGETHQAEILVSAVGQLDRPNIPDIPGRESFTGLSWHSAQWNHKVDLKNKNIAVIGNGASAVQFLPSLAEQARKTTLFQRTPNWIQRLANHPYPAWSRWCFKHLPLFARMHRLWIFLSFEARIFAFSRDSWINREYARVLRRKMRSQIPEEMWCDLVPEYQPGCKRILLSNDYLKTLCRNDVHVVTAPATSMNECGVKSDDEQFDVDIVIFATGFKSNEFLAPLEIRGRNGKLLHDAWNGRPRAFRGLSIPEYPNLFLLYGPNTNLGHNSVLFMVERQVRFIIHCLRKMRRNGFATIEVTQEAMQQFDEEVQTKLKQSVWSGDCTNWYKTADGNIPNNWWGSAIGYWMRTRKPKRGEFRFE